MYLTQEQVAAFHVKMGLTVGDPTKIDITRDQEMRVNLIGEEYSELCDALAGRKLVKNVEVDGDAIFTTTSYQPITPEEQVIAVADALGDLIYVIAGAAITWGIDLTGVLDAIHESNMTKTPGNKRSDGKLLKGPDYVPPNIAERLAESAEQIERDGFGLEESWWPVPTDLQSPDRDADEKNEK